MKKKIFFTILLLVFLLDVRAQTKFAVVAGRVKTLNDGDTAIININKLGFPFYEHEVYRSVIRNHQFYLKIPLDKHPVHQMSLMFNEKIWNPKNAGKIIRLRMENYYLDNGDNIFLSEVEGSFHIKGKGAEKFNTIKHLQEISKKYNTGGYAYGDPHFITLHYKRQDSVFIDRMQFLNSKVNDLSANTYDLLKADAIGEYLTKGAWFFDYMNKEDINIALNNLKTYHDIVPAKYLDVSLFDKKNILKYSSNYTYYGIQAKYRMDSCVLMGKKFTLDGSYIYFAHHFGGALRERLLMNVIYMFRDSSQYLVPFIDQALGIIKTHEFKDILSEIKLRRIPGRQALNFSLPDTLGNLHSLKDYQGKVVLLDFWFTGCGSCKDAAPYLEKIEEYFKGRPVVFISINDDKDHSKWVKSVFLHNYTSQFSLDLSMNTKRHDTYDNPISTYYNIASYPTFILIGKNGKLATNPQRPQLDDGAQMKFLIEKELEKN